MERIETESDWLECEEPSLFRRFAWNLIDQMRFRYLAFDWAKKFVHLLHTEWEKDWFRALEKWIADQTPSPRIECDTQIFVPLGALWGMYSPGRAVQDFFIHLQESLDM